MEIPRLKHARAGTRGNAGRSKTPHYSLLADGAGDESLDLALAGLRRPSGKIDLGRTSLGRLGVKAGSALEFL
jgi:hypothetical protein